MHFIIVQDVRYQKVYVHEQTNPTNAIHNAHIANVKANVETVLEIDIRLNYHVDSSSSLPIISSFRSRILVVTTGLRVTLSLTLLFLKDKTEVLEIIRRHEVPIQVNWQHVSIVSNQTRLTPFGAAQK